MMAINDQFVMSTELECLTTINGSQERHHATFQRLWAILSELAPALPCGAGIFNAYGRVYVDCSHIELAASECASPFDLPSIVERQQALLRQAVDRLRQEKIDLLLANNNHSGLLTANCATWGAHENYLTERHPTEFCEMILPFLVTRIYAGAGGIEHPTGRFLAATRPLRMELTTGGGTTESRAIHSTAREEHHMGRNPTRFRYHLILGDGHRSHFNMALQFAATALALKAIFYDRRLGKEALEIGRQFAKPSWVSTLRRFNVLCEPGKRPEVDRAVVDTQRVYLAGAERYAGQLENPPEWIALALRHWSDTLDAFEKGNIPWLAARLDAFAKYEFYTAVLNEHGKTWSELSGDDTLFHELALLDHSYHAFGDPRSVFHRLEEAGVLNHRVGPYIAPGGEDPPFVPCLGTRADVRARFIRENSQGRFAIDWSEILDLAAGRVLSLHDPFATSFTESARRTRLGRVHGEVSPF